MDESSKHIWPEARNFNSRYLNPNTNLLHSDMRTTHFTFNTSMLSNRITNNKNDLYSFHFFLFYTDQTTVTRGCLSDLIMNTQYRLDMPQLRRHGYCVNSRDYQHYLLKVLKGKTLVETAMGLFSDENMDFKRFCYCNDFNGCNHVNNLKVSTILISFIIILTLIWIH